MKTTTTRNAISLFLNLVLLALFVLLGSISFQADSATSVASASTYTEMNH